MSKSSTFWIAAAALVVLGCHLQMALSRGINWDEFHYFDWVRQFHAGTLTHSLQSFHARLFGWLLGLPGDVTDHIRAGRIAMLACVAGTGVAIFGVARRFASPAAAALAALTYLSGGYVVIHGTAFRTDPQAAFLLAGALWVLAAARLRPLAILGFGLLAGLAAMVTIKAALWAPAFAGVAWLRWRESPRKLDAFWRIAACGGASLIAFVVLHLWHAAQIADSPAAAAASTVGSAGRVVFSEGFMPQWRAAARQLLIAPQVTVALALTAVLWVKLKVSFDQRLAMLGLLAPLAALLIYRNSYPYFFVFLLPPVLIATAPAMDSVVRRFGVAAPTILMAFVAVFLAWQQPRDVLPAQKRTIAAAQQLFPGSVTYFDFCGYLGGRRAVDFMPSGWGLVEYRRTGRPVFAEIMDRETVPLVVLNHNVFISAVSGISRGETLLKDDVEALRDNYIPHWGILWVAGKFIPRGEAPASVAIRVPGRYTLERSAITLDGVRYEAGQTLDLKRGVHEIGGGRPDQARLRWGDHLPVPAEPAPTAGPYASLE